MQSNQRILLCVLYYLLINIILHYFCQCGALYGDRIIHLIILSQASFGCNLMSFTNSACVSDHLNFVTLTPFFTAVLVVVNLEFNIGILKNNIWVTFWMEMSGERFVTTR